MELRADLYAPETVNGGFPADTEEGDVDAALSSAAVMFDETYTTPMEHNPMEPHTTGAIWRREGGTGELTLYDSNQGAPTIRQLITPDLEPRQVHVISPHVGGAFGSKYFPHAHVVLAAQIAGGRPVKLALTRQQMFSQVGCRTIQRVRPRGYRMVVDGLGSLPRPTPSASGGASWTTRRGWRRFSRAAGGLPT